jgi:hypothetical protein
MKTPRFSKDVRAGRSTARSPYMKMLRSGRCVGGVTAGLSPQCNSVQRTLGIIEENNNDIVDLLNLVPDVFNSSYRNIFL